MSPEGKKAETLAGRLMGQGVSASVLKHVAVITMLIDHVTCCFLEMAECLLRRFQIGI